MNNKKSFEVFGIRHSKSNYNTYGNQKKNGKEKFDPINQEYPDLSKEGLVLAHEKAKKFFSKLNPETDVLFFVSSNEARAIATADIYRQEAILQGFEFLKPGKTNSELADKKTEGYIRTIKTLSSNPDNYALHSIFVPDLPDKAIEAILQKLPEKMKEKWLQAREIINNAPAEIKNK